ncbi:MAG: biopolymer transporter ExbD [Chitinophagaceae bacterium]|nr:MAG: biopolymer transporter ExbD [Chitinophagaceae bacterium]
MSKFKKDKGKGKPGINTASLPDIIFILLFFFMVVTVIRELELKVRVTLPQASEITVIEPKSLVSNIYIGPPTRQYVEQLGTAPRIQLNDAFSTPQDIALFVEMERNKVDERLIPAMTWSLRVDQEVRMGIVSDVKQELRKSDALKINYAALPDLD